MFVTKEVTSQIEKTFEEEIKGMRKYQTPGTPGFRIVEPTDDEPILESDMQSRYRTGVGMLMYLIKHSRPDIMNACRELTKVLGTCTIAAYKEMLRCVKFVSRGLQGSDRSGAPLSGHGRT